MPLAIPTPWPNPRIWINIISRVSQRTVASNRAARNGAEPIPAEPKMPWIPRARVRFSGVVACEISDNPAGW